MLPYFRIPESEHNIFSGDAGFGQFRGNAFFCVIILNPYFVTGNFNFDFDDDFTRAFFRADQTFPISAESVFSPISNGNGS
jgi:hypothetical protein